MIRTITLTCAAIAVLTACAQPPVSETAGPNTTPANPTTAGQLFATGCLQNLPNFTGTAAALSSLPVTQRASSGIYYHNTQNISLKLLSGGRGAACNVTFGTNLPRAQAIDAFGKAASATAPGLQADIALDVGTGADGLLYFSATTAAQ